MAMALKKKPVTGMKDILPGEMELRQYVLSEIRKTYREFGFTEIETPVESISKICFPSRAVTMKS
jgi:histidyl-tRNA synthetase